MLYWGKNDIHLPILDTKFTRKPSGAMNSVTHVRDAKLKGSSNTNAGRPMRTLASAVSRDHRPYTIHSHNFSHFRMIFSQCRETAIHRHKRDYIQRTFRAFSLCARLHKLSYVKQTTERHWLRMHFVYLTVTCIWISRMRLVTRPIYPSDLRTPILSSILRRCRETAA